MTSGADRKASTTVGNNRQSLLKHEMMEVVKRKEKERRAERRAEFTGEMIVRDQNEYYYNEESQVKGKERLNHVVNNDDDGLSSNHWLDTDSRGFKGMT